MAGPVDVFGHWIDQLVVRRQSLRAGRSVVVEGMAHAQRLARLGELRPLYDDDALLRYPGLLAPGPVITPTETRVRADVRDVTWPSPYEPWSAEVRDTYLSEPANLAGHARVFDGGPRTVVVVHGYGAGHFNFEEHLWPVRSWRKRDLTVVLVTLPFHGRRAVAGRALAPPFPGADPRLNVEGFRHAVSDITSVLGWLRAEGRGPVGVVGMSLGGYTTALLATLEADLAFAGLIIPLASIADYARAHGRLGDGLTADALHAALEATLRPVSPLARPSRVPSDRVHIIAARGDAITGVVLAERLAAHFGVNVEVRSGSHTVQIGLRRALDRWMQQIDF